jgi:hypothetical protein
MIFFRNGDCLFRMLCMVFPVCLMPPYVPGYGKGRPDER